MLSSNADLLDLLSDYVCDTQSSLAQYVFHASEKHKEVKNFLLEIKKCETYDTSLIKKLRDSILRLDDYLYNGFEKVFEETFHGPVERFFRARYQSKFLPRLCVKIFVDDTRMLTLLRQSTFCSKQKIGTDQMTERTSNTAFVKIEEGQRWYLCNNIPVEIENKTYTNTRINREKVIAYNRIKNMKSSQIDEDKDVEWVNCWEESGGKAIEGDHSFEDFYKSTLVIPMSLLTDKLSEDFLNHFQADSSSKRVIFGFLCFDHPRIDYFLQSEDKDFGYIVADLLSLYLIQIQTYTQYSTSYREANELISS
jgi:hypothetical protein